MAGDISHGVCLPRLSGLADAGAAPGAAESGLLATRGPRQRHSRKIVGQPADRRWLRAGGLRVFTKTTGFLPAVIGVDGVEMPLFRRGRPGIKEQLHILRLAAGQNADVLVVECMAVLPEYQKTSEEAMLRVPTSG